MIVVIGSPSGSVGSRGIEAAGLAVSVARSVAAAGASVQIVGRVGEDSAGEAVLLDLAAAGVGHVAVLRTGGAATPGAGVGREPDDGAPGAAAVAEEVNGSSHGLAGMPLDAPDVELALRYLPDYGVLVAAPGLAPAALATVMAAAGWSGARLIVIVDAGSTPPELPTDATVLERPADGDDDAFAAVVARYAVELDRGTEPAAAFAAASTGSGWTTVTD